MGSRPAGLVEQGAPAATVPAFVDLSLLEGYWGSTERGLAPPVSLLSWLIRNLKPPQAPTTIDTNRRALLARNPETVANALNLLRSTNIATGWYIFEGLTYPDALLITPDAIIVVEGKRTEPVWKGRVHDASVAGAGAG